MRKGTNMRYRSLRESAYREISCEEARDFLDKNDIYSLQVDCKDPMIYKIVFYDIGRIHILDNETHKDGKYELFLATNGSIGDASAARLIFDKVYAQRGWSAEAESLTFYNSKTDTEVYVRFER